MQNVSDIIASLGSNVEVAKALGLGASTVSEFKRRNSIPVRYWHNIIDYADTKGVDITYDILVNVHVQDSKR